jgi:hypothetical protein
MACCESQSLKMPLHSCTSCWVASSVRLVSDFFYFFTFSFSHKLVRFLTLVLKFAETVSFHGGITLASIFVLESLDRFARWRKRANIPSSIRQQLRHVNASLFFGRHPQYLILFWGNFYGLDTRTYLCVCSTLHSSSSCSSLFYPSGDRKFQGTRLLPLTYTKCRWRVRSGISWTITSSTGHG